MSDSHPVFHIHKLQNNVVSVSRNDKPYIFYSPEDLKSLQVILLGLELLIKKHDLENIDIHF